MSDEQGPRLLRALRHRNYRLFFGGQSVSLIGFLMTASGLGALAGALYLASRSSVLGLGRAMVLSTIVFGIGLVAFSFSRLVWVSLLLLPSSVAG